MKCFVAFASLVAVRAQVLEVPDYFHYMNATAAGVNDACNGVKVQKWDAIGGGEGFHEGTLRPPMFHKLRIPAGKQYPCKGTSPYVPPSSTSFWLITPAHYVVTKGKAQFTYANGTKVTLDTGDYFYSPAGVKQGAIKPLGGKRAVVLVLGEFPPRFDKPPALIPSDAQLELPADQFAFQPRGDDYGAVPAEVGLPDCIKIAGGTGVIGAKMEPNCTLPFHYHGTGAFYFYTKGALKVGGDIPDKLVTFPSGTARWARPSFAYGPEISINEPTEFMVLGLPPTVGDAPNTPELVIRDALPQPLQVAYKNTQVGKVDIPAADLRQKRVRRHLRSNVDHEEAAFLQHPHFEMEEEL